LAIKGVDSVLRAIPLGACRLLVVDEDYYVPGYLCQECAYLDLKEPNCAFCAKESLSVEDVIEEAMEEVLLQRGEIKHIAGAILVWKKSLASEHFCATKF